MKEALKNYLITVTDKNSYVIEFCQDECYMKTAIRKAVRMFFAQEVTDDNDIMTAHIYKMGVVHDSPVKVAELSFNALQLEDGKIRYEIILTDQHNINHDYRGNM